MLFFIFCYILVWWMILFMVLPIGVKVPEKAEKGHAASAPSKPYLWRKLAATTVISFFVTLLGFYLAKEGYIDLSALKQLD